MKVWGSKSCPHKVDFFTVEYLVADAHVVDVCPLVGAAYDDGVVCAVVVVAVGDFFDEFVAWDVADIFFPLNLETRTLSALADNATQLCCILQDA